jgi:5-methylcytosine-specific restriction endonuclease McrA
MSKVFVLDTNLKQLNPVHPGEARRLLSSGKAAVYRRYPFTIVLKVAVSAPIEPLRVKLDPGSKTTGIAVTNDATGEVVFAAELTHRGMQIKGSLDDRRASRRSRRNRHTRYRAPRFNNRPRHKGWLPPSLQSRIANVTTWVQRLARVCRIANISMESVRFDTQLMENAEISGIEYQQGTLAGYETREYLLEKWKRTCAYCGKQDVPLQVEHIQPRAKGGSNRISNLCLACEKCNIAKGTKDIKDFLKKKPELLKKILAQAKAPMKDAAAVNSTRKELFFRLQALGLPIECGSGGLTKFNRTNRHLPKTHWLDAACVGKSTPETLLTNNVKPLLIKAMGSGTRQMCQTDKYGFPKLHRQRKKKHFGFQTGDMVRAVFPPDCRSQHRGKVYTGRVTAKSSGSFKMRIDGKDISVNHCYCTALHRQEGYQYGQ